MTWCAQLSAHMRSIFERVKEEKMDSAMRASAMSNMPMTGAKFGIVFPSRADANRFANIWQVAPYVYRPIASSRDILLIWQGMWISRTGCRQEVTLRFFGGAPWSFVSANSLAAQQDGRLTPRWRQSHGQPV